MSERMTKDNQIPASMVDEIEIMVAVGGLSPAQKAVFKRAAEKIAELEATEGYQQMLIEELEGKLQVIERLNDHHLEQLAAVRALPDKWEKSVGMGLCDLQTIFDVNNCAQQLRKAIAGGEDE